MMYLHGNTDIGRRRKVNQDTFATLSPSPDTALCVVCDGMGGAVGGAEASRIARDSFAAALQELLPALFAPEACVCSDTDAADAARRALEEKIPQALCTAAEQANRAVYDAASADPSLQGMGTTLIALLITGRFACAINVGDSRLYAVTPKEIRQLSHDHSYVQYLVDLGKLTPEEARMSTNRNIITRAVGTAPALECDVIAIEPELVGQAVFLLCSDGLSGMLTDEEIADVVRADGISASAVDELIARANAAGGTDNITVVLAGRK